MTSKFKVGDMVIFNEANKNVAEDFGYNPNKAYEIKNAFLLHGTIQLINENGMAHAFDKNRFLLAEPKQTKNQRITALENEVAELRPLKNTVTELQKQLEQLGVIVDKVRKPSTVVQESLTAASSVEDISPVEKSPNEKRAEVIEKAKMFIEKNKNSEGYYSVHDNNDGISFPQIPFHCKVEFIVNEEKRTVIALMRGFQSNRVLAKGIAKCMPGDVFNKYIGMAIALGRALGLDVSEFEQAVQPNEFVVGQIVRNIWGNLENQVYMVTESYENHTTLSVDYVKSRGSDYEIINDTNAIYGGGE